MPNDDPRDAALRAIVVSIVELTNAMLLVRPAFSIDQIARIQGTMLESVYSVQNEINYDKDGAYRDYLGSPRWGHQRLMILDRDGYTCVKCRSMADLQVHHKTYDRRGMENDDDLVTLCKSCHEKQHDIEA